MEDRNYQPGRRKSSIARFFGLSEPPKEREDEMSRRLTAEAKLDGIYECPESAIGMDEEPYNNNETDMNDEETDSPSKPVVKRTMYSRNTKQGTIFSSNPIATTVPFDKMIKKERIEFIICLFVVALCGPLVFRYAMGSDQAENDSTADTQWGSRLDVVEWVILLAIFFDMVNSLFRGLPMLSGRPTDLASSRTCIVDGTAVLGLCSPFVSEDDAILLRSLLGRTCTAFHTCGGRHNIRGLYVDTILNEKRYKGEENRKKLWFAWMRFLTELINVCKRAKLRDGTNHIPLPSKAPIPSPAESNGTNRAQCPPTPTSIPPTPTGPCGKQNGDRTSYAYPVSYSLVENQMNVGDDEFAGWDETFKQSEFEVYCDPDNIRISRVGMISISSQADRGANQSPSSMCDRESKASISAFEYSRPRGTSVDEVSAARPRSVSVENSFRSFSVFSEALLAQRRSMSMESTTLPEGFALSNPPHVRGGQDKAGPMNMHSSSRASPRYSPRSSPRFQMVRHSSAPAGVLLPRVPEGNEDELSASSPPRPIRTDESRVSDLSDDNFNESEKPSTDESDVQKYKYLTQTSMVSVDLNDSENNGEPEIKEESDSSRQSAVNDVSSGGETFSASREYLTGNTLVIDLVDIVPMIGFLKAWLNVIKDREWTYDYTNKSDALERIFLAAPFIDFFPEEDILEVHHHLRNLYDAFTESPLADGVDKKEPLFHDDLTEIKWLIRRYGLPDWDLSWSLFSRARLRPLPKDCFRQDEGPPPVFESTRIKPGSIVCAVADPDGDPSQYPKDWFKARNSTYKVTRLAHTNNGNFVYLKRFPPTDFDTSALNRLEDGYDILLRCGQSETLRLDEVELLEQNRGKAGALNVYARYLRTKAVQWVAQNSAVKISTPVRPAQIFMGIVDARHMLSEPGVFWNDALPYFSLDKKSNKPSKRFGDHDSSHPICMVVQYPQYFTNVIRDDYLDNKNGSYYTIWQTLRDCAKSTTSSGTNAIWEITNSSFEFATSSRIEDTGTSQKYLHDAISVHMPCFVACGIAKQTEDYIEAVYRWSTGAVELFWSTLFSPQLSDFIFFAVATILLGLACFHQSAFWYFLWIAIIGVCLFLTVVEKRVGKKPIRPLVVTSVIVLNTMYWISNLLSVVWTILMPLEIAVFGRIPLASSTSRSMFWMLGAVILRLPPTFMADRMSNICRFINPHTKEWNYNMALWRSSQLYACSFAYALLSFISGTRNAIGAYSTDKDLTMWSSFRVPDSAFSEAKEKLYGHITCCSLEYMRDLRHYVVLCVRSVLASLCMPDVLTKWYASALLLFQV
mmetsp:Transcript_14970/g.22515  ORF Transcript_14970/g.22515 Transcript_14970/m.22515 type:complete len:1308 (-) Transcript_14970:8-3931(-)